MNVRGVDWVNGPMPVIDPTYLARIFASTSDVAFLVRSDGTIMSALVDEYVPHHKRFAEWGGRAMQDLLTSESIPKFESALKSIEEDGELRRRIELNHSDGKDWEFPVRYSFHAVGPGKSVLMLGHDLRIDAEMQEQLIQAQVAIEKGFEQRRAVEAHYHVLLSGTAKPFVFISVADGRLRDLNVAAAAFFGKAREDLIGVAASDLLRQPSDLPLMPVLSSAASGDATAIAAKVVKNGREVLLSPTVYRANGERIMFCRISEPTETRPVSDGLSEAVRALYLEGPEAIAFCSSDGTIREANDAFLELLDLPSRSDAIGRSLGDFLFRGQIDLGVILKQVRKSGRLGLYSTRLINSLGERSMVQLSATVLGGDEHGMVGFVFRDAEKGELVGGGVGHGSDEGGTAQNVVDLVGSATLKEIVADANEVIEKICIETALNLTQNNRAAAAEMLGMSRQSLYVKLRRYGLIDRHGDD